MTGITQKFMTQCADMIKPIWILCQQYWNARYNNKQVKYWSLRRSFHFADNFTFPHRQNVVVIDNLLVDDASVKIITGRLEKIPAFKTQ